MTCNWSIVTMISTQMSPSGWTFFAHCHPFKSWKDYNCTIKEIWIGPNKYMLTSNFFNFVFYLKIRWGISRVTQKYFFFENILSFSAPNSPLNFLNNFKKIPKKILLLTFLLIAPPNLTRFSSVIPFWKAEGLTSMVMHKIFR